MRRLRHLVNDCRNVSFVSCESHLGVEKQDRAQPLPQHFMQWAIKGMNHFLRLTPVTPNEIVESITSLPIVIGPDEISVTLKIVTSDLRHYVVGTYHVNNTTNNKASETNGGGQYEVWVWSILDSNNVDGHSSRFRLTSHTPTDLGYCDDWRRLGIVQNDQSLVMIEVIQTHVNNLEKAISVTESGNLGGSLTQNLGALLTQDDKDTTADLVINSGKEIEIKAHRAILCARSPVFRAMLNSQGKFAETKTSQIDLQIGPLSVAEALMDYVYTGSLTKSAALKTWREIMDLYTVAELYEIPDFARRLIPLIEQHLNPVNAMETYAIGQRYHSSSSSEQPLSSSSSSALRDVAQRYIVHNLQSVTEHLLQKSTDLGALDLPAMTLLTSLEKKHASAPPPPPPIPSLSISVDYDLEKNECIKPIARSSWSSFISFCLCRKEPNKRL